MMEKTQFVIEISQWLGFSYILVLVVLIPLANSQSNRKYDQNDFEKYVNKWENRKEEKKTIRSSK